MITIELAGYLNLKKAQEMLAKYTNPRVASGEDFNGMTIYSYVDFVQFDDDDEALMFMIEAADSRPEVTSKPFKAGHKKF